MIRVMLQGLLAIAFIVVAVSGGTAQQVTTESPSIGRARMLPDRTIALRLRAETAGTVGDAYFEVGPGDPTYEEIRRHIGGLDPGDEKPVPPWPESFNGAGSADEILFTAAGQASP